MVCVDSTQSVEETIHHGNFYLVLPENSSSLIRKEKSASELSCTECVLL